MGQAAHDRGIGGRGVGEVDSDLGPVRCKFGSAGKISPDVCFSNRPFRVKRFQTIHHYSVDVAHGLVLFYGIGTKALPSWGSRRGGTIFGSALPLDER